MENSPGSVPDYTGESGVGAPGGNEGTGTIKEQAGQVVQQAKEQAGQVVQQAKEKAGDLTQQARDQIMSQLSGQKDQVAGTLDTIALAFMQTGQQLRDQGQRVVGDCVEQAAQIGDQLSSYLRQRDVNQIVGEVEDFARRQPALFLGTAFAIGFFTVRFLKSSTPSPSDGASGQGAYAGGTSGYGAVTDIAPAYGTTGAGASAYGTTGYGGGAYGTAGSGLTGSGVAGYGTTDASTSGYSSSGYGASTYSGSTDASTGTGTSGTGSLPTPLSETALAPTDTDDEGSYQAVTGSEVP